jgi:hypothetical protein
MPIPAIGILIGAGAIAAEDSVSPRGVEATLPGAA